MLSDELALLRKYAGFTPARLAKVPYLMHVLGGSDEPIEAVQERFISAIQSLREPESTLLLAIFGLAPNTADVPMLSQRREIYGRQIGRSVETVADLEPAALEHLRRQLVTGWYPLSPASVQIPMSHNGAIFESVSIRLVVQDRRWLETRENHRFFAAFDEADYVTISSSYPGTVSSLTADFSVRTRHLRESYSHDFWHREPMRRGQAYDLRFRIAPEADRNVDIITESSRAFHEPTRLAQIEVVFIGTQPKTIWQFQGLTFLERPGVSTSGTVSHIVDRSVRAQWRDVYGGLFWGVAWEW